MKRWMTAGALMLAAILGSGCSSSSGGGSGSCDNLAGNWSVSGQCGGSNCTLSQDGCNITWNCDGDAAYGTVRGSSFSVQDGGFSCSGSVNGNSASGSCREDGQSCSWTAVRSGGGGGSGGSSGSGGSGGSSNSCVEAGYQCAQTSDCCGGTRCVDYADYGVACGALCTSGSGCKSGCCVPLKDGTASVCAPADFCGS